MEGKTMVENTVAPAIEVQNLTKRFGRFTAVDDLSSLSRQAKRSLSGEPTEPAKQRPFAAC